MAKAQRKSRKRVPTRGKLLAAVLRRAQIRRSRIEGLERTKREARTQVRHERAMARREKTATLARVRISACTSFPSRLAVQQLAAIASHSEMSSLQRVRAASLLLKWALARLPG
jgi:hypothetical protein